MSECHVTSDDGVLEVMKFGIHGEHLAFIMLLLSMGMYT